MNIGMEGCGPNPRTYSKDEYDALHAEAEALQQRLTTEQGNAAYWKEQYQALRNDYQRTVSEKVGLRTELEAARGLLRDMRHAATINPSCQFGMVNPCRCMFCVETRVNAFLTATPAPEVRQFDKPSLLKDCNVTYSNSSRPLAEQVERQEPPHPAALRKRFSEIEDEVALGKHNAMSCFTAMRTAALYTLQPVPDVRGLVEALEGMLEYFPEGNSDGECFSIEKAEKALAAHRQAQQGDSHDT